MSPRAAERAVDAFGIAVAASVGLALAGLTWRLLGDPGRRFAAVAPAARPPRAVDVGPLAALAPFGTAAPVAAAAADQSLALRGILLAEPASASAALISVNGAAPVAFAVGQAVGPGTIAAIGVDQVVLAVAGGRQVLAFPQPGGATATGATVASSAADATPMPPGMMEAMASPPPSAPPSPPPSGPPAAAPPSAAAMLVGIGAPAADGLHVGQPNAAMLAAGLQPGDVVAAVNGVAAADAARNPALLGQALASGTARLDVTRGEQHLTLTVPLR